MRRLDSIFDIRYGQSLELNALKQVSAPDGVNFVSRAMRNNGVTARVVPPNSNLGKAGEITVALSGNGVLSSFVQPEDFVTGFHVMILTARDPKMSLEEKLWWCRCIWENRHRFSYGRQANRTLASLLVPDEMPDWAASMTVPTHDGLSAPVGSHVQLPDLLTWSDFALGELFEVKKGKRVTKAARTAGSTRFIGASDKRNGITDHCDLVPNFEAGTLTVPYNGSVGFAFYQDKPYFACDDIQVLVPRTPMNKWVLLFIATMVRYEKGRFTYGYKWHMARMRKTTIKLPATSTGDPDWCFMESFMKGLPFSAAIADD